MGKPMGFRDEAPTMPDLGELSKAETLEGWINEAPLANKTEKPADPEVVEKPWRTMRRNESPSIAFNLRMNTYERELLAYAAAQSGRSMQAEAKDILFAALERRYGGSKVAPKRIQRRAVQSKKKAG